MIFFENVANARSLIVRQRKELVELFGFETRNKYEILNPDGGQIGFAAEQQKGWFGFLIRQLVGHWRTFDIVIFDLARQEVLRAHHPFRFYFQRLDVTDSQGHRVGSIEKRFSILSKKFEFFDEYGKVRMSVKSPIWRIWTFPVMAGGEQVAKLSKRWGGILTEVFTDADRFEIEYLSTQLSKNDRILLLVAALFVDLHYFEAKANSNRGIGGIADF